MLDDKAIADIESFTKSIANPPPWKRIWRWARRRLENRRRMREWKAFLKEDADWDYDYILRTFEYKLARTRKCILANNIIEGAQKVADEIAEVEALLRKVIEDNYFEEVTEEFQNKHGELKMDVGKDGYCKFGFSKRSQEESDALREEWHSYHDKAHAAREEDLRKAFDLMATRIWGWWD
jgi:hypothetical protein